MMLCHCRAPLRARFGDTRTPHAAGDDAVPSRASRGLGTTLCRQLSHSARRMGVASWQLALINISAVARQRGHGHAEECWRRASREAKGSLPPSLPWQPRRSGWRAARGAWGEMHPSLSTAPPPGWVGCEASPKIPLWERDRWAAPGGMPWGPPSPRAPPAPRLGLGALCRHPDPLQQGGMRRSGPRSPPSSGAQPPRDSRQLLGKTPVCKVDEDAEPPAQCPPVPPSVGPSHPCPALTEGVRRLQIPAPGTYFLHAGECVLQQVRDRRDLVGRRRRICVWAPCFMAPESGRWRQAAASSTRSLSPTQPCRGSRTPRLEGQGPFA